MSQRPQPLAGDQVDRRADDELAPVRCAHLTRRTCGHRHLLSSRAGSSSTSVEVLYRRRALRRVETVDGLILDDDQRTAAAALDAVARRLGRRRWTFPRGLGSHALPVALARHVPRGVYLHGRPGRGKTMLMDEFFERVESTRKCRFHFHQFFARLHAALAESGALPAALDALLGDTELICFDEFHVH